MKHIKSLIIFKKFYYENSDHFSISFLEFTNFANAQGCIIVRNISGFTHYSLTDRSFSTSNWVIDATSRYFKAYRDFKGEQDLKTPAQDRSVNKVFTFDFTISRMLSNGWTLTLDLPVTGNTRTTSLEHGGAGTARHSTHSFGIGICALLFINGY